MKRLAFVLAILIVVALAAEAVCRLGFSDWATKSLYMQFDHTTSEDFGFVLDDRLFWKPEPGNRPWEINADGYRGPLVPKEKSEGEFRLACLGDSCTFGLGGDSKYRAIPYADTFTARLNRRFAKNRRGLRFTAINFGCPGYTSFQGLRLLKDKVGDYRPDAIVAYFGINDGGEAFGYADKDQRPFEIESNPLVRLLRNSYAYMALRRLIVSARRSRTAPNAMLRRVSLEDYHRNLDAMTRQAKRIDARIYYIAPPYLDEKDRVFKEDFRHHEPAIDVLSDLRRYEDQGHAVIFSKNDKVHPRPMGHKAIAEAIAQRLAQDTGL